MTKLTVDEKTGFRIRDPYTPVIIRDFRGILFYSTEDQMPKVKEFNLPPGEYFVESGKFTQMAAPVKYRLLPIPFPERFFDDPGNFEVRFGDNPHKCTISFGGRWILFDESFKEKPIPQIWHTLYHEFGHAKYKTEKYADTYAHNCMLKKGFNPYQISRAHIMSLSAAALERKVYNAELMIKSNGDK